MKKSLLGTALINSFSLYATQECEQDLGELSFFILSIADKDLSEQDSLTLIFAAIGLFWEYKHRQEELKSGLEALNHTASRLEGLGCY
jgi:hypothetical protein